MNLHALVSGAVATVNPFITATIQSSTGYTIAADGTQVPAYAPAGTMQIQVQPLQYTDLTQLDGLNIQGLRRKVYTLGHYDGVVRADGKGGDLMTFSEYPGGPARTWLVAFMFEEWPDWCSLALTLQNG